MDKANIKINTMVYNTFMINSLNETLKKFYKINDEINFFNANLKLITNYHSKPRGFNNENRLVRLLKKRTH